MKIRYAYRGKLNSIFGIWYDVKPDGLDLIETITFYSPDEGKAFKKGDEIFSDVVLQEGESIEDYVEIDEPKENPDEQSENDQI